MDGRRHSIDVPISKTLVALRRVRSLRDPSTNSMTKLSSLIDNAHWENGSNNGISLRFSDASRPCDSDDIGILGSKNLDFKRNDVDDFDLNSKSKPRGMSRGERQLHDELNFNDLNHDGVSGNTSPSESCCSNLRGKGLDLACIMPPINHLKDDYESSQLGRIDHNKSTRRSLRQNEAKPSELMSDIANHAGSPCLSAGDAFSPHSASTNMVQDVDLVDNNHHGCGISCCWSKSPRFRELIPYSDIEGRPLIPQHIDETSLCGHRSMRHNGDEFGPILETPRSLCMKFRPRSFSDLVGQNVVTRSLLGAISTGRITSFYLFHGPRGTGKTSASRIFSAALNCLSAEERRPCGLCRECVLFFSGRSKDVKEVDSMRLNRTDKVKSLLKGARDPPVSSRFKIYVIDECQLLHRDTWASILNSLENFSQHVVFVMITPDLDKLPRSAVSRAQRYHFPKIKDADIASRLEKICIEEGLDYELVALNFIAAKSCGSLRDAEMMLDQLSLLGKKITISLAYELTGVVSDDELLDLLDVALSSDTSNTVIKARELMRSRIDPLQLISQLANLIMDILAGKCEDGISEVGRRFSSRHHSEADLNKLSHALRILSETEKQLRISKNQTTWFTVALLQLSSAESSAGDANETQLCLDVCNGDAEFCSTSSTGDGLKCPCDGKSYKLGAQEDHRGTLDSIWYKATELCQSNGLKTFLRERGKLASLFANQGLAVAELEFHHRNHVSRAEKSWKLIASSLQLILGCHIELRINLVRCTYESKFAKSKRAYFNFFSCSRRMQRKSFSSNEQGSESDYADYTSQNPMMKNRTSCSSDCGSQVPRHECSRGTELVTTLRDSQGNVLSSRKSLSNMSCQESPGTPGSGVDSSKEEACKYAHVVSSSLNSDNPSNCFPWAFWLHKKKLSSPDISQLVFESQQEKDIVLSIPHYSCGKTYSYASEPHDLSKSSKNCTKASRDENGKVDLELLCWRISTPPLSETWQRGLQQQKSHIVRWVLPCASAK